MKLIFSFLSRFSLRNHPHAVVFSFSAPRGFMCLCLPSPCSALSVLLPLWTHARNMCPPPRRLGKTTALWLRLWGVGYGVARRRQPGQFPGQVGGVAGWWERPHLLPAMHTHTHTHTHKHRQTHSWFAQKHYFLRQPAPPVPCRSLLHTHLRTHLHFWFYRFRCSFLERNTPGSKTVPQWSTGSNKKEQWTT